MYFFDYGNAFLLTAKRAGRKWNLLSFRIEFFFFVSGAPVGGTDDERCIRFKYPSYVQDIMGDIFSLGFGPFRWVCTSGLESDLRETDRIAQETIKILMSKDGSMYSIEILFYSFEIFNR
jgi:urocanate hydratase